MGLNRVHLIRTANVGPTKIRTYCGMEGWHERNGYNEYSKVSGDRFEAQKQFRGVTCKTCLTIKESYLTRRQRHALTIK